MPAQLPARAVTALSVHPAAATDLGVYVHTYIGAAAIRPDEAFIEQNRLGPAELPGCARCIKMPSSSGQVDAELLAGPSDLGFSLIQWSVSWQSTDIPTTSYSPLFTPGELVAQ